MEVIEAEWLRRFSSWWIRTGRTPRLPASLGLSLSDRCRAAAPSLERQGEYPSRAHATFIQPSPAILQSPAAITQAPRLDPDAPCVKSGRARLRPEVPRLHFGRQACPGALYRDPGPAPSSRRALLHLRRPATIRTRPPPLYAAAFTQPALSPVPAWAASKTGSLGLGHRCPVNAPLTIGRHVVLPSYRQYDPGSPVAASRVRGRDSHGRMDHLAGKLSSVELSIG